LRPSAALAAVIAIVAASGPATAGLQLGEERGISKTVSRAALPGGLVLTVEPGSIAVERGALRAPLSLGRHAALPRALKGVDVDDAGHVVATITDSCGEDHAINLTIAELDARLDDVAAETAAAAQVKAGKPADAVRTLAPLLGKAPIATYAHVATDPALAPLLRRPELAKLRAPRPGTAKLPLGKGDVTIRGKGTGPGTLAVASQHHLIAILDVASGRAACASDADLLVVDPNGAETARLALYRADEMTTDQAHGCPFVRAARPKISARVAAAQRVLADLGFSPAAGEAGAITNGPGDPQAQFPQAKLTLVLGSERARILAGEEERGAAPSPGAAQIDAATHLAEPGIVVVRWRNGGAGCGRAAGILIVGATSSATP
jgi:hypothetical protein